MTITLHKWIFNDKPALMALCNAVDRTFLSDRLPNPYTEADADWWLEMVSENEGKEGVWRSIWADGQMIGSKDMIKESHTRLMARSIPRAELVILPGNHFVANKQPEAFNAAVMRFLN